MIRFAPLFLIPLTLLAAKPSAEDVCGTGMGRAQQELFLHRRLQQRPSPRAAVARINKDVGNISVIDDSLGAIARRNAFNLDRQTLTFTPASGGGYQLKTSGDTFDALASVQGTRLDLADDDAREITLPFPFRFFGTQYRSAWVNSNGSLTFERSDLEVTSSYGHFVSGPPAIAPLFMDLDPSVATTANTGVRVIQDASRVVVTWASVPLAGSTNLQNFQLRIYPDGRIEFAYRSVNPITALTGMTPGGFQPVQLVGLGTSPGITYTTGFAETFSSADSVDIFYAAQRFYETHEDAYDYLVFYNTLGVRADAGIVAYEVTTRSSGDGYGDVAKEIGTEFGSKKRLQAVLNMGPLSQYPVSPTGTVPSRGSFNDTPLSLLGHEAGHLFLALVSVPDPANAASFPMLTSDFAHWAFPFNSEASFLGGNRIEDRGPAALPRFRTTGVTEQYSPLDQYLMGLRAPEEVPPTFAVLNSGMPSNRASQVGVTLGGTRLDIRAQDIVRDFGRRTPDSTVAQRKFRFGFVLIVPSGSELPQEAIAQVDRYRTEFEPFFAKASGNRAVADTSLKHGVTLSLAPASGVLEFAEATASLEIASPAAAALTFRITKPNDVLYAPSLVTIPAGATRATFPIYGGRRGVEEFAAEPLDTAYETAVAHVQVSRTSDLGVSLVRTEPLTVRVQDQNKLGYAGVRVNGIISGSDGSAVIPWTTQSVSVALDGVVTAPRIDAVVNAASYQSRIAPNTFVTIFGANLLNARITLNGAAINPIYTSDKQVNFLAPATISPGPAVLTMETASGIAASKLQFDSVAPGIFRAELGLLVISGEFRQAKYYLYCTGLGSQFDGTIFDPMVSIGPNGLTSITAEIDGAPSPVTFVSSVAPGLSRVWLGALSLTPGTHSLTLSINGIQSNTVNIQVTAGN